ncbi:hypothetical protein TRIUR3_24183 [Triticum urartu]|uniref:Uncharacterized protein n=2 Tax=Triticum urartu TaxID=4572 RepID=M7YHB8_TRIUA|nr:hypothetical protein TRIUR3_24183 [Triticum urartu]
MSGRKAIDVQYSPPSVVEWAVPLLRKGKVVALFDPRVAPPRDPVTRRDLASLAASCVRSCRERRPSMADIVERLAVISKAVSAKVWNGMAVVGNPCAIVDVQKTISKRAAASEKESTSALAFDDDDKEADATLEELVPLVGAKKPPRPLKNGKVFSEAGDGERRNLLELMARIDGVAGQRFGISRARTVRGTSDLIQKDAVLILRRNQTVRVVESEALGKVERVSCLDASIKHKPAKEFQEKPEKMQDKADGVQERAEKIQEKEGKIQENPGEIGKVENIQEKTGQILDKAEKIEEKTGQILDKAEKIQGTPEKVQENERKIQEHTEVVQHNVEKIQDKAEKIQCKLKQS